MIHLQHGYINLTQSDLSWQESLTIDTPSSIIKKMTRPDVSIDGKVFLTGKKAEMVERRGLSPDLIAKGISKVAQRLKEEGLSPILPPRLPQDSK